MILRKIFVVFLLISFLLPNVSLAASVNAGTAEMAKKYLESKASTYKPKSTSSLNQKQALPLEEEEEEEDKDKDKEGKTFGEEESEQSGLAFWCCCSLVLFFFARGNESLGDKKHHHIHRLLNSTFIKAIKEEAK